MAQRRFIQSALAVIRQAAPEAHHEIASKWLLIWFRRGTTGQQGCYSNMVELEVYGKYVMKSFGANVSQMIIMIIVSDHAQSN